jgi:hypothetical protein
MQVQFNDSHSMGVTIWLPAVGFSFLSAVLLYEKFNFVASILSFVAIFLIFLHMRRRLLTTLKFEQGVIEFSSLGGVHSFPFDQIISCSVHGVHAAFTLFMTIRIKGRRWPIMFQAGALSTSAGDYKESIKQVRLIFRTVREKRDGVGKSIPSNTP